MMNKMQKKGYSHYTKVDRAEANPGRDCFLLSAFRRVPERPKSRSTIQVE